MHGTPRRRVTLLVQTTEGSNDNKGWQLCPGVRT